MLLANLDHYSVSWMTRGSHKGTTVFVHTSMIKEQKSSNKLIPPFVWVVGRVTPVLSPWCAEEEVPQGEFGVMYPFASR